MKNHDELLFVENGIINSSSIPFFIVDDVVDDIVDDVVVDDVDDDE